MLVTALIPPINSTSSYIKSQDRYKLITANSTLLTINSMNELTIERLFVSQIPKNINSPEIVLLVARIGKLYHNMAQYLKFVQNNLGCNLSENI